MSHQQQFQFPPQAQRNDPSAADPNTAGSVQPDAESSSLWVFGDPSQSRPGSAAPSSFPSGSSNVDTLQEASSSCFSYTPLAGGPVGDAAAEPPETGLLAPIVITASSGVSLVAPRPVRARRHQKSIIAVEAFVPQLSTTTTAAAAITGDPAAAPGVSFFELAPVIARPLSMEGESCGVGGGNSRANDQEGAVCGELAQLAIGTKRAGGFSGVSRTHVRVPSVEFGDEIPFPSFSSSSSHGASTESVSGLSGTNSHNSSTTSNIMTTAAIPTTPIPADVSSGRRRASTTRSRARSRKASLLEHWDVQSIRLGGPDLVGSTDVSLFLPADLGPPRTPESGARTAGGAGPGEGLHVQTSDLAQLQPMQLYSPTSEAVSELFQIMRHTSLAGSTGGSSSAAAAWGGWPGNSGGGGYEGYGEAGFRHLRTPSSSSAVAGNGALAMGCGGANSHGFWSMSSVQSGVVPPSPVSRTSRNPIVANDAFQAGLGGAASAATAVGAGSGGFSFPL